MDTVRYDALDPEVPQHRQEQLMQTMMVCWRCTCLRCSENGGPGLPLAPPLRTPLTQLQAKTLLTIMYRYHNVLLCSEPPYQWTELWLPWYYKPYIYRRDEKVQREKLPFFLSCCHIKAITCSTRTSSFYTTFTRFINGASMLFMFRGAHSTQSLLYSSRIYLLSAFCMS